MKILIDADACPLAIKEILYRVAKRYPKIILCFIANQQLTLPRAPNIQFILVEKGFDIADKWIIEKVSLGDLVVTADIPLAEAVISKNGFALNPRGEFYTEENIKQKLAVRNLMAELRSIGSISGGPAPIGTRDKHIFANALDKFITKALK